MKLKKYVALVLFVVIIGVVVFFQKSTEEKSPEPSNPPSFSLADVPEYSSSPFVALNNDVPNFTEEELKTVGYEEYRELDALGRCTYTYACVGVETMPKEGENRGDIGSVKPTGWVQAKYDTNIVEGGYLYNRSHLIGWQLTAENANKKNLITGTRYFNVKGMLPFENEVAEYVRETQNHVAYRVTPIFEGDNLLCNGVQMEAYSVEDNGAGVSFNVYCYNVQPKIKINYITGESSLIE